MKINSSVLLISAALWLLAATGLTEAREPIRDLEDLAKIQSKVESVSSKVMPSTVALISEETGSSGSGVITTADGLILTAAHVIQGAEELMVVFPNGAQVKGKVLGANYSKDIGMVKIINPGPWPFVGMGASKPLQAGDWVIALGHSAGFDAARTPPVRFGRVVSKGPGNFLTTDCTLIGGDSGGPLFDLDGKIIGINSSIGLSLTNNNHAGIDGFRQDWDRLVAGEAWGQLQMNPFANPEMPVLGIGAQDGRGKGGVTVGEVAPRSPAAAAGLRIGDVIEQLDDKPIRNFRELTVLLAKREAGDQIKLQVKRDSRSSEINVTLARRGDLYEER
jgi:serine protease Do